MDSKSSPSRLLPRLCGVWARALCPDRGRATIAVLAAIVTLTWQTAVGPVFAIGIAAVIGWWLLPATGLGADSPTRFLVSKRSGIVAWILLFAFLFVLPLLRQSTASHGLEVFDSFFRVGSLVFGGGHVVLPLLRAEVVGPNWVTNEQFVAGYGAAQAVPGPLFTFSAYLGAAMNGWSFAALTLVAVFLPSFLLVIGALPFWDVLRAKSRFRSALGGINAAVVGLLLAALYNPIWISAIHGTADFGLGLLAFGLLVFWQWPPWLVVVLTAIGGELLARA